MNSERTRDRYEQISNEIRLRDRAIPDYLIPDVVEICVHCESELPEMSIDDARRLRLKEGRFCCYGCKGEFIRNKRTKEEVSK